MAPLNEKTDLWLGTLFLVSGVVLLVIVVYLYSLVRLQKRHAYANVQHRRSKQQHGHELLRTQLHSADAERSRIAGELHDNIASSLAAIKFQLYAIDNGATAGQTAPVISQVERTLDDIALLSRELHAPHTEAQPLEELLEGLVSRLNQAGKKTVLLSQTGNGRHLNDTDTQQLYRVLQELLHNSFKYSAATTIRIGLRINEESLDCNYCEEDGDGYCPDSISPGLGLQNINRRLALIGAVQEPICLGNGNRIGLTIQKTLTTASPATPDNTLRG